ncbi:hypothetical protein FRC16_002800 [Serendipita sp. 398]|nr:hypothetical protein FRC16_002800 [Serendipita sp. 398]
MRTDERNGRILVAQQKDGLWKRPNKGIAQRMARDDAAWAKLNPRTAESLEHKLKKKSMVYEQLQKGKTAGLSEAQIDALLVDFDTKGIAQSSSEDDSDNRESPERESESLVEITDEFGRTRHVERSKVPRLHSSPNDRDETAYTDESNVLRGPHITNFPVYQPSAERVAKILESAIEDPIAKHYDATNENRSRAAGFYQFSADDEIRKRQMKDLAASREETMLAREINTALEEAKPDEDDAKVSRASSKRKRDLEERRALLDAKRRKLGVKPPLPVTTSSRNEAGAPESQRITSSSLDAMDFLANLSRELHTDAD